MNVLFVANHSYLPQRSGGSESSTHDLCISLITKKVNVAVLAELEPKGFIWLFNRIKNKFFKAGDYPYDKTLGYRVFRGWSPVRNGIDEIVKLFQPSVVVVQAGSPLELVKFMAEKNLPVIFYLRDVLFDGVWQDMPIDKRVEYVANSRFTAQRLYERTGIIAHVVPPLVVPSRYKTETSRKRVVFVCPHPLKGDEIAFKIAENRPDIQFDFVESWHIAPEQWDSYSKRAKRAGNINMLRRVSDMRTVYKNAKIVLVPSQCEEAWCRVVTEAQLNGIPALASNRGGLPESVGDAGVIVEYDAPIESWLRGLSELWDSDNRYEQYVKKAFDYSLRDEINQEKLIERLITILERHASRCEIE